MWKQIAILNAAFFLSACAINPLPEDVTGINTYDIVRQIRCESRASVLSRLLRWLEDLEYVGNPVARKILADYRTDPDSIAAYDSKKFLPNYPNIGTVANLFSSTGIAYSFDLTMTEDNDLTSDFSLINPLSYPKFTLGLNAGLKRKRANQRVFVVTDTFMSLLRLNTPIRGQRYCDGKIAQENNIYPISGRIGVDNLVRDFMNVTVFTNLSDKEAKPNSKITAPTMADKLTFTTTVNLTANPKIEFTPLTAGLQLTSATITSANMRTDTHQVTVALAVDTADIVDLQLLRTYIFSDRRASGSYDQKRINNNSALNIPVVVGSRVTGGARTNSEALAVIAIDQLKSRELQLIVSP